MQKISDMKKIAASLFLALSVLCGFAQIDKGQLAPTDVSVITVSVDPEGSGTATGGGTYENGVYGNDDEESSVASVNIKITDGLYFMAAQQIPVCIHI